MRWIGILSMFGLMSFTAAADGTCNCRANCADRVDPSTDAAYDDEKHRLWYEVRFWTGKCEGEIWASCWSGSSWYDVMEKVLDDGDPEDRPEICERLFEVGVRIGHEWARDNAIRVIHTKDLDDWRQDLLSSDDPIRAIDRLEALVDERFR